MVKIGDEIEITSDNECYKKYKSKTWIVASICVGTDEHPFYDMGVYPQRLVECDGLPFALYEWEFDVVR